MRRRFWLVGGAVAGVSISACSIYDTNVPSNGGAGGTSTGSAGSTTTASSSSSTTSTSTSSSTSSTTSSSGTGGTGGSPACMAASECPGADTECRKRTCVGGVCGTDDTPMGTTLATQTAGDCKTAICDGAGNIGSTPNNTDKKDDANSCTTDGCSAGTVTHVPVTAGTPCSGPNGAKVCSAAGVCVECVANGDCASNVCKTNICVAAQCNDLTKNGAETDVDCGGGGCPPCGFDKICGSSNDCVSQSCVGGHCAATCTDMAKNGSETDVDCGGSCATKCASGKGCLANGDCTSDKCSGNKCVDVLLISEVQTRGTNGGSDEFLEVYNPNAYPVTFDATWEVWTRNATSACAVLNKRITGGNQVIPSHGHLLFTNASAMGYNGAVVGDATYTTGFTDSGQIVLLRSGALVDSLCYYFSASTQGNLTCPTPPAMWFACQGAVSNSPHNDTTGGSSATDVSMDRKPGGAAGNGQSTGNNTTDFTGSVTANPQNLMSAVTP